jgi:signal transduction histidine kinase
VSQLSVDYVGSPDDLDGTLLRLTRDGRLRYPLGVALLAALYYGSARLGFELNFAGPIGAIVWLPAGVAIAYLCLGGLWFWPGVLIGDLLTNDAAPLHGWIGIGTTCGNLAEVLVATIVIRRFVRRGSPADSIRGVGAMVAGIGLGAAVSATIGTLSSTSRFAGLHEGLEAWRTWWLGDANGGLVVVPLVLAWWRGPPPPRRAGWLPEAALLLVATCALSELAFRTQRPLTYLVFPALIWAALRFGPRGATLAVAVVVGLSVWNTTHFPGPFVAHSASHMVLSTQLFIAAAAVSALFMAAVVTERARFAEGLAASRARLMAAADSERRRLERNLHDGAQQRLTVLAFRLREAAEQTVASPGRAAVLIEEAETELQLAIDELRELAHGIHPATLTDFGFAQAVEGLALRSPVRVDLDELPSGRLGDAVEATAYYVVAEAVTNAQKHARAASIRVRARALDGSLLVDVDDDGVGGADESRGSGLQGLRDRVEALGGTFRVASVPGRGTRVGAAIPLAGPAA